MRRLIPLLLLLLASTASYAEAVPTAGPSDKRVKVIDYDPNEVVLIVARFGYTTDVHFNDDENIIQVALGDSSAWAVAPVGHHLFLKPKFDNVRTNAIVLTDKNRLYNILLTTATAAGKGPGTGDDQFFQITYRYPQETKARVDTAKALDTAQDKLAHPKRDIRNVNYFGCGSPSVTPDEAFDDGRFTYMRFAGNRKMPTVYAVGEDGSESIVNSHVETDSMDTIVVHQLARRFVFRLGSDVGCVVNKGYDPKGINSLNGTVTPEVERTIKGVGP
jgi:type IV secretion system protein VirB9